MMKIKGVNFWPQTADAIVLAEPCVEDFVGDVQFDERGYEVVTLRLEPVASAPRDALDRAGNEVRSTFKERVGFDVNAQWTDPGELPKFDYKVKRWTDGRTLH